MNYLKIWILFFSSIILFGCGAESATRKNTAFVYPPWSHTWGIRQATPFKLRLFVGNKTHFNDPQGIACVRLQAWDDTTTEGDDDEVTVYGVNSGENCLLYNTSMFKLQIYGLEDDHEPLNRPWGLAADDLGNVFVVDRGNSRVVHLTNSGTELSFHRALGEFGDQAGQFIDPRCAALDTDGRLYVTDAALGRITVFNADQSVNFTLDSLSAPDGIAVIGPDEKWTSRPDLAFLVVSDSLNLTLKKYSLDGQRLLAQVDASTLPVGEASFGYLVIDFHGQIVCTDSKNGCLHKFDRNLNYLTTFGCQGEADYEFDQPRGIAVHRKYGQTFVAERQGAQYLWVGVDVSYLEAKVRIQEQWRDLDVDFFLSEPATGQVDLIDDYGRFMAHLITGWRFEAGHNHFSWGMVLPKDQTLAEKLPPQYQPGQPIPAGQYRIRASFKALYSSRQSFERRIETRIKIAP